jgi:hypothetical protein
MLCIGMIFKIPNMRMHIGGAIFQKLDHAVPFLRLSAPLCRFDKGLSNGLVLLLDEIASGLVNALQLPRFVVKFLTSSLSIPDCAIPFFLSIPNQLRKMFVLVPQHQFCGLLIRELDFPFLPLVMVERYHVLLAP